MKFKVFLFLISLILLSNTNLFASINKNILIINSYHKGFQWSDDVISGIEEVLYDTKINSTILYMDSKRISSSEYYKELKDLYSLQLKTQKYDLVVAIDRFAYEFSLQNYSELFTDEPIFFVGIEQFSKEDVSKYKLEKKVSGLLEKRAISDISEMIYKLMPRIKKLYIINDKSANGDDTDSFIKDTIKRMNKKIKVEYIRSSTLKDLKDRFSIKKENEAVFFIRFYNDKDGGLYKNSEIADMINSSKLPVFTTDTLFIEKGSLGGKLVPIKALGITSGEKVLSILTGELKTPNIETFLEYNYVFDYEKINEFNFNLVNLRRDYTYVNTPKSFFDEHRILIDSVFLVSPFLLFLIAGLIHNIYLRIQNAKKLKERMEFDKVLLNAIDSPIVWQDNAGKIVDRNSKFSNLMDFPCPLNRDKKLKDYVEKKNVSSLVEFLKNLESSPFENNQIVLKGSDNKEYIYLINQTNYIENLYRSTGTVTIFTDITKEKQAQRERVKHQEFIIQQSKLAEIGEIFSSIAHQWKSPLVEISTIAQEQLYSEEGEVDEKKSEYVNDIMVQVKYMADTINDFQKFIKPSSKKTVFDIQESVHKMMNIIDHNIRYNYINVNINVAKNTDLKVYGYRNELMQTLLNIVNNAKDAILKARKKKEITDGIIDIRIKNIDNFVEIEIEDNGGGIPSSSVPKIFDSYFTTKEEGHGIGLYMAKLIIEDKMRGKISMENTKKGAKFNIRLEVGYEDTSS